MKCGHTIYAWRRVVPLTLIAASLCIAVAACGSSSSSSSSSTSASNAGATTSSASGASSQFTPASLTEAKAGIAPFLGQGSPFPLNQPLGFKAPTGKTYVFMNCGNPECEEYIPGVEAAAKALGWNVKVLAAGLTPQTVASAFDAAVQLHPAGILDPGLDPILFKPALAKLNAAHIPVIAIAIEEGLGNGITGELANIPAIINVGKEMADYVYTQEGNKTNTVFVDIPEIQLSLSMAQGFVDQLHHLCPSCSATTLPEPASTIGSTLPSREVSYLQQHPNINWLVNFSGGLFIGVPQALKAADIKVKTLDQSGGPVNMQYLKQGLQTADLATDNSEWGWFGADMIMRADHGGIPASMEGEAPPQRLLTQSDITFNPSNGWIYPGYQATFEHLWGLG